MNITKEDLDYRTVTVCACHKQPVEQWMFLDGKRIKHEAYMALVSKTKEKSEKTEKIAEPADHLPNFWERLINAGRQIRGSIRYVFITPKPYVSNTTVPEPKTTHKPPLHSRVIYRYVCLTTKKPCQTHFQTTSKGGMVKNWNEVDINSGKPKWVLNLQ